MKVEEIRQKLIESGYSEEEVSNIKGKRNLMQEYNIVHAESLLEKIEEDEEKVCIESNNPVQSIQYEDAGWSDYVMSQFQENELSDGHPTVHGLRRLVEVLLGPILSSKTINLYNAGLVCQYEIIVNFNSGNRVFGGVAGANPSNIDGVYAAYPEAIAETRAEVRALRKALRLNVPADEELSNKAKETVAIQGKQIEWNENEMLDTVQNKTIKNLCEKMGLDIDKLVLTTGKTNLDELTRQQGADLILLLNKFQTGNAEIPSDLKKG